MVSFLTEQGRGSKVENGKESSGLTKRALKTMSLTGRYDVWDFGLSKKKYANVFGC